MTLRVALTQGTQLLERGAIAVPRLTAEVLLAHAVHCDRTYLYAHSDQDLREVEWIHYGRYLHERLQHKPTQYITHVQEFYGRPFYVDPAVLIPRPETEQLIEAVLELQASASGIRRPALESPKPEAGSRILDVGTGSGAIALALAKELPQAEIHATDISAPALEVARANAARHQLESRIQFHEADLIAGFENNSFDFIVSNPPYVGESEEDQVQLEVRKFEPRNAVFAGPTGTEVIARFIPQAHATLKPGGWLVMEISGTIAEEVTALLRDWNDVQIRPDLQSIPRVAQARR